MHATVWKNAIKAREEIDRKSLLIDTGSTFSCINNPVVVTNLRKSSKPITRVSNGGVMVTDMEGDMLRFFTVYVNEQSLMNILALATQGKDFELPWTQQ